MDEFNDAWFGPENARQKENAFAHFLFHELAH
jgi:hypothetical protein